MPDGGGAVRRGGMRRNRAGGEENGAIGAVGLNRRWCLSDATVMGNPGLTEASLRAWKSEVVMKVVDESLEATRVAREKSEAIRARREAEEARAQADAEQDRRRREQVEADDARQLADENSAAARAARRQALIEELGGWGGG